MFCCAIDPKNGNLAVSGGQDDKAYVWETQNGTVIIECEGHSVSNNFSVSMSNESMDKENFVLIGVPMYVKYKNCF